MREGKYRRPHFRISLLLLKLELHSGYMATEWQGQALASSSLSPFQVRWMLLAAPDLWFSEAQLGKGTVEVTIRGQGRRPVSN